MVTMNTKTLCLYVVLISVCSFVAGQEAKQIRWKFDVGDEFELKLAQTTGITTNIDTRRKQIGNEMMLLMDWKIESVEGESITILQSIRRIKLTINQPTKSGVQTTEVDTDNEDEAKELGRELLQQIQPLIGTEFTVVMTTRGEITDVVIPRASMGAIRKAPASMILRQVLTENGMKELLGQSAIVFPELGIKLGDDWQSTEDYSSPFGTIKKTNRYLYDGTKKRGTQSFDEFAVKTKITASGDNETQANIEDFSGSGRIWFAVDGDTIMESQFDNKMKTSRQYRDKIITSAVSTNINTKVQKK